MICNTCGHTSGEHETDPDGECLILDCSCILFESLNDEDGE